MNYPDEAEMKRMDTEGKAIGWPGTKLHFCNDWDGMLIHDKLPEFDACLCFEARE